jgi:hypothetical protein
LRSRAAVAVMGKEALKLLKTHTLKHLGRLRPRKRRAASLIASDWSSPAGDRLRFPFCPISSDFDWSANETSWSLVSDMVLIASLFMLEGEFWNHVFQL